MDGRRHTKHAMCVCGVRRAMCVSVSGRCGMGRARRERRQGWTAWVVGVVGTAHTQPHTHTPAWVAPQCAAVPGATTHTHTHTADRAGQRTQWWWLVGMGHSGGGSHTTHTQPPPPRAHHPVCVCVSGRGVDSTSTASGWTKWPHTPQHPRCHHHIHHQQQQQQEEEWCGVGHKEWVDW